MKKKNNTSGTFQRMQNNGKEKKTFGEDARNINISRNDVYVTSIIHQSSCGCYWE
jgi:hypothetical protein